MFSYAEVRSQRRSLHAEVVHLDVWETGGPFWEIISP